MIRRLGAFLLAAGLLCGAATIARAQTSVSPSERDVILNPRATAAADTAVIATLTGVANQKVRVYGFTAYCSAGSSTVTIAEGATTKWTAPAGFIGTELKGVAWTPAPHTAPVGVTVTVTLATCGGGNTGVLQIVADRY